MGSIYGDIFRISTFGESHGKAIGVIIDGCPSGINLSEEDIQEYLDRRKPGQSKFTTPRKEEDLCKIMSGVFEGRTRLRIPHRFQKTMTNWLMYTDPVMQTILIRKSTVSGITEAAAEVREERL